MRALPLALAACAAGAVLLQWQPVLPPAAPWLGSAAMTGLAAGALRRTAWRSWALHALVATMFAAASAALGFGYAAYRAGARLADELPARWEGVDVTVTGVVDELPQPGALGTRFAFAVERVETAGAVVPPRLSLVWYAPRAKDDEPADPPPLAAGERWRLVVRLKRPHGTVNPHGFDVEAWLLENGFRATGYVRDDRGECATHPLRRARHRLHPARTSGAPHAHPRGAAGSAVRRRDRRADDR